MGENGGKWGKMGGNGRISSYFASKWRSFECQTSNASAFLLAVRASNIPRLVSPLGLLLVQFSLCFFRPQYHGGRAPYRQGFNVALTAAANKVSKYLQLLPFAKSARVLERAVLGSEVEMGSQIETSDCLFRKGECSDALRAEWDVSWKLPAIASTTNFRILDLWEGMSETLPLLYAVARRALAVPATSCGVERCFSSLKWVRDERQRWMKCETHAALQWQSAIVYFAPTCRSNVVNVTWCCCMCSSLFLALCFNLFPPFPPIFPHFPPFSPIFPVFPFFSGCITGCITSPPGRVILLPGRRWRPWSRRGRA